MPMAITHPIAVWFFFFFYEKVYHGEGFEFFSNPKG